MIFIQNKYTIYYYNIILSAKSRLNNNYYTEKHHIIPKSLNGDNSKDNLVSLSAREHYICHLLLTKMTTGEYRYKMIFALNMMFSSNSFQERYIPKSKLYDMSRRLRSEALSKAHNGRKQSIESNIKRSLTQKGVSTGPKSAEHKLKLSIARKGISNKNKGKTTCIKGKTYEEIYGVEKANLLKKSRSITTMNRVVSIETRTIMSNNRKGKRLGGDNSNAKSVTINNITYSCKKDAQLALNLSLYALNKLINN